MDNFSGHQIKQAKLKIFYSLILKKIVTFLEPIKRNPGDVWMIKGPLVYTPPVEVDVKSIR